MQLEKTKVAQKAITEKHITEESENLLIEEYKKASKRLILLDYDGTLVGFQVKPEAAVPDEELLNIIEKISNDPSNQVVIISGRDRHFLEKHLGKFNVDFIAEHGVWLKEKEGDWARAGTTRDRQSPDERVHKTEWRAR